MNKREVYIDKVKGFAIILIVLGHIILQKNNVNSKLCIYIYTFHVPIFFIISEILVSMKKLQYQNIDIKGYIKYGTKRFLYPYFTFSIIYILYLIIKFMFGTEDLIRIIKISLNTIFLFGYGPAWFLPTLLFSEVLFVLFMKGYNRRKKDIILIIIGSIWIIIWSKLLQMEFWQKNIILDFSNKCINLITRSIIGSFFIVIGYMYNEKKNIIEKIPIILYVFLLILNIYISQINSQTDLHYCVVNNILLYFYLATFNSVSIIKIIESYFNNKNTIISFWGENSLIIMLTHFTFPVMIFGDFFARTIIKISNEFTIIGITFLVTMLIESIIIVVINKKIKILLKR